MLQRPLERWLTSLAMSFIVIAAVLAWQAYQGAQKHAPAWQIALMSLGAAIAIALGAAGIRVKHRHR